MNQSSRAAKRVQAPAALRQVFVDTKEELTGDETISDPLQGMANRMDSMMAMILELSQKVHGHDMAVAEQMGFPLTNPS